MSFEKIYALFRDLPDDKKHFAAGRYVDEHGTFCAVGAAIPRLQTVTPYNAAGIRVVARGDYDIQREITALGMTVGEIVDVQIVNDGCHGTEQERYEAVMTWLSGKCEYTA